jgi:hypothetical protein
MRGSSIMSILDLFSGKNKQRAKHEKDVTEKVHRKKNQYTADMLKLKVQTQKIHATSLKSLEQSKRLNIIVNDIASSIAVATGGLK